MLLDVIVHGTIIGDSFFVAFLFIPRKWSDTRHPNQMFSLGHKFVFFPIGIDIGISVGKNDLGKVGLTLLSDDHACIIFGQLSSFWNFWNMWHDLGIRVVLCMRMCMCIV